jgi:hypothetical protein
LLFGVLTTIAWLLTFLFYALICHLKLPPNGQANKVIDGNISGDISTCFFEPARGEEGGEGLEERRGGMPDNAP